MDSRGGNTWHTHDRGLTLLPPPERLVPSLNSSIEEGGWALWRPLRTNTDKNTGRGPPEWNRQTGTMAELGALEAMVELGALEAMAELGALEAMAELGALEAMAVQGAPDAMAELGALEAMAELGALEAMADGLRGPWPRSPRPGPYSRNSYYPPKKISLGKWGGIRSPPGLNRQDSTKQDRNALQGQTDRTAHRNQKPSWAGLEAEASSGHDQESEALTGSLSDRLHIRDKGAGG